MAEGTSVAAPTSTDESDRELCAVCLEPYVHPAKLPCGHVFCFLCIKGTANRSKRCAMCRQEIPHDFVDKPTLVDTIDEKCPEGNYQWYYEGRNGWWQYDERTSKELETAYKNGEHTCEMLVAGFLYVMDLEAMLQLRRNDPSRRRRIKRDLANIDKIGIAGLRCSQSQTYGHAKGVISLRDMSGAGQHVPEANSTAPPTMSANQQQTHMPNEQESGADDSQRTIICDPAASVARLSISSDSDTEEE